jgi:hypothetical protein
VQIIPVGQNRGAAGRKMPALEWNWERLQRVNIQKLAYLPLALYKYLYKWRVGIE